MSAAHTCRQIPGSARHAGFSAPRRHRVGASRRVFIAVSLDRRSAHFLMAQQAKVRRVRARVSVLILIVRPKHSLTNHSSSDNYPNKNPNNSHGDPCTRDMFSM